MINKLLKVKGLLSLILVTAFCMTTMGAIVSDNDGSAFITKAEFDSLKNDFQNQIDSYNTSIDSKIDGAIASYLAGLRMDKETEQQLMYPQIKQMHFYSRPNCVITNTDQTGDLWYERTNTSPPVYWSDYIPGWKDDRLGMVQNSYWDFAGGARIYKDQTQNSTRIAAGIDIPVSIGIARIPEYGQVTNVGTVRYYSDWILVWTGSLRVSDGQNFVRNTSQHCLEQVVGTYDRLNGIENVLVDATGGINLGYNYSYFAINSVTDLVFQGGTLYSIYSYPQWSFYSNSTTWTFALKYSYSSANYSTWTLEYIYKKENTNRWTMSIPGAYSGNGYTHNTFILSNLVINPRLESYKTGTLSYVEVRYFDDYFKSAVFARYRKSTNTPFYIALEPVYVDRTFDILNFNLSEVIRLKNGDDVIKYNGVVSASSVIGYRNYYSWTNFRSAKSWDNLWNMSIGFPKHNKVLPLNQLKNYQMAMAGLDVTFHEGLPLFEATETGIAEISLKLSYWEPRLSLGKNTATYNALSFRSASLCHYNVNYDSTAIQLNLSLSRFDGTEGNNSTLKFCDSSGNELDYAQYFYPNDGKPGDVNPGYKVYINVKKGDTVWIKLEPMGPSDGLDSVQIADFSATIKSEGL